MDSPAFQAVPAETTLENNVSQVLEIQGKKIALVKTNDGLFALDNSCRHLGGSLGKGIVRNNCIVYPLHRWSFELSSGKCVNGGADEKNATHEVKVEKEKFS